MPSGHSENEGTNGARLHRIQNASGLNIQKLWRSGRIEHKRTVLRLAFADRIIYCREKGIKTSKTTLPFIILAGFCGQNYKMVPLSGASLNSLFDELSEFEAQLKPFADEMLAELAPQPLRVGGGAL